MKRSIVVGILILLSFVLQTTLFNYIELASIKPNLMLIIVVSFGLIRGPKEGSIVGFVTGLLYDITFGNSLGLYALIFLCIGYGSGFFNKMFYEDGVAFYIGIIALSDLFYNCSVYILTYLLRGRVEILFYTYRIIIPSIIYTCIISMCLFRTILYINDLLDDDMKRGAH